MAQIAIKCKSIFRAKKKLRNRASINGMKPQNRY